MTSYPKVSIATASASRSEVLEDFFSIRPDIVISERKKGRRTELTSMGGLAVMNKPQKPFGTKGMEEGHRVTVMAACRASGVARDAPQPIIKGPIRGGSPLAK